MPLFAEKSALVEALNAVRAWGFALAKGCDTGKNRTMLRVSRKLLVGLALFGASSAAYGQVPAHDAVAAATDNDGPQKKLVPWHDSTLIWQQRTTTETVGIGGDYQSRDPYYDWVFYLRPRWYFWETERSSVSARGQLWTTLEFTNDDTTTDRNELVLEDSLLGLSLQHAFVLKDEYLTDLTLTLPRLVFPTSKASFNSGNIVQVGVRVYLLQAFPLRTDEPLLPRAHVGLRAGYQYQFARSVVPELSTLNQARMDLGGHSVSNDQIGGGGLPEHLGSIHAVFGADIWRDLFAFETEFGIDPTVKFKLPDAVCVDIATGCAPVQSVNDPQRLTVITWLDAYFELRSFNAALKSSIGYENITSQLTPGGERRNALWSPDAKFYLKFEFQPDLLFERPATTAALPPGRRDVASLR